MSFKYVFNIGILLSFFLVILATYIIISNKEQFAQCVYRPNGKRINSLNIDINISKTKDAYELSLSEFKKLIQLNKINSRENMLSKINEIIKKTKKEKKSEFEIIYELDDEVLIYRRPSAYGFHLKFINNPKTIQVLGVVNHYDIISQYKNNILKKYHTLKKIHFSNKPIKT